MMAERAERMNKCRRASEESSVTGTESGIGVGSDAGVRRVVGGVERDWDREQCWCGEWRWRSQV